jgi:diamine N-acetyltransferase
MMKVSLREIDKNNFRECVNLKVAEGQETFVAPNVMSIAQSKIVFPHADTLAVYAGDEMVGFVMFGYDAEDERFYLGRLMIDEKHQGKGFGKAAVLEVIERAKQTPECSAVYLSFVPENTGAEKLYSSVGFEKTGEIDKDSGEIVMRFDLKKATNNRQPTTDN